MVICVKVCKVCKEAKQLTEDFWYRAKPTATHPKGGWQSNCKSCWKIINKENSENRKVLIKLSGGPGLHCHISLKKTCPYFITFDTYTAVALTPTQ